MAIEFGWKSELRAIELLKSLNFSTLPIDPFQIAKRKDIACQQMPSLGDGISGCMMKVGDNFGILYSARFASEGFQNFTVGHELGHYCMDGHVAHLFAGGEILHRSSSGFISSDLYEQEADAFAAALLMPRHLFEAAMYTAGEGFRAIEILAVLCRTSLTATAVRFARLSQEPVAVVCSEKGKIHFAVMSPGMKQVRDLTWIKRGAGVPAQSLTASFNNDESNIRCGRRASGESDLADWFHTDQDHSLNEEVCGLGEYGRSLTVLWTDSVPERLDPLDKYGNDDVEEGLLPSEKFFRRSR